MMIEAAERVVAAESMMTVTVVVATSVAKSIEEADVVINDDSNYSSVEGIWRKDVQSYVADAV